MKTSEKDPQNDRTTHGENIANDIQGEDAYGASGSLTAADVWNILDNLHTHFLDTNQQELNCLCGKWMGQLEKKYPNIERY